MTQLSLIHGCRIGLHHRHLLVRPPSVFCLYFWLVIKKEESGIFISPSIQEGGDFPNAIHIHIKNAHIQSGKMDLRKIQDKDYISSFTYKEFKDKLLMYLILFAST